MAQLEYGETGLWTRINALNSPWALDDINEIVRHAGNKLDVMMLPKVEGPWDIYYLDQLLAQLEARHKVTRPILIHRSEEHTSELQSRGRISYAVFCLKKKHTGLNHPPFVPNSPGTTRHGAPTFE